jgi:succinate-acetate transporter protein
MEAHEEEQMTAAHAQTRAFIQPIAAPSILGLYGFAGATFVVASNLAGWYGNSNTAMYLFPFAAFFGGLAQFMAGMWAYRARDGLATAMHGMWGAFWMAYGLLNLLFATGTLTPPTGAFPALGFWFIALGWITWMGFAAALGENAALAWVLGTLGVGSTCMAIGQIAGAQGWIKAAGWLFIISAIIAWYTATALMFESVYGRTIFPVGKTRRARQAPQLVPGLGEPGVKHGQ